jgi:hypothetical protein
MWCSCSQGRNAVVDQGFLSAIEEAICVSEFYNAGVPGRLKHLPLTFPRLNTKGLQEEKDSRVYSNSTTLVVVNESERMTKSLKNKLFTHCLNGWWRSSLYALNKGVVPFVLTKIMSVVPLSVYSTHVSVWISLIAYLLDHACMLSSTGLCKKRFAPVTKCLLWYKI